MTTFQGIPAEAFSFYAELEDNNNREWWLEHKDSYNALVRDPFLALLDELEPRFGPGRSSVPTGTSGSRRTNPPTRRRKGHLRLPRKVSATTSR